MLIRKAAYTKERVKRVSFRLTKIVLISCMPLDCIIAVRLSLPGHERYARDQRETAFLTGEWRAPRIQERKRKPAAKQPVEDCSVVAMATARGRALSRSASACLPFRRLFRAHRSPPPACARQRRGVFIPTLCMFVRVFVCVPLYTQKP